MIRPLLAATVAVLATACLNVESAGPPASAVSDPVPTGSNFIVGPPPGWGGGGTSYSIGTDAGVTRAGGTSGSIRAAATATANTFASLTQQIRADSYRGRRVRLAGQLRTINAGTANGVGAGLWLRIDGKTAMVGFDNMNSRYVHGTSTWTPVSVVLDVPDDALGFAFGALLVGPGQMWVDELRFEAVGTDVPVTAPPATTPYDIANQTQLQATYSRSPAAPVNLRFSTSAVATIDQGALAWLTAAAVPFDATAPGGSTADLEPLRAMVGTARIVALGEATHGTSQFFTMKHRVLQHLVEQLGFTAFAIEATWPEANAVNEYVLNGTGDPAVLLSNLYFWTWNTQEVLDMIRWMRQYNTGVPAERRVRFYGFDMQSPGAAIDTVKAFVQRVDSPRLTAVTDGYACLTPYRNNGPTSSTQTYSTGLTGSAQTACATSIASVYTLLATQAPAYTAASSATQYARALQSARLVVQWEDMSRRTTTADAVVARDKSMAENVGWLLGQMPAGSRMMLWAHNAHVSKVTGSMGGHLATAYGANYLAMGFAFGTGTFNAVTFTASGQASGLATHTMSSIEPGSFEAYATLTQRPRFIVDMRAVPTTPAAAPLSGPIPMKSIGSGFSTSWTAATYHQSTLLPADFDVLIYFDAATRSTLLPFRYQ